jgi:hypothetical protein
VDHHPDTVADGRRRDSIGKRVAIAAIVLLTAACGGADLVAPTGATSDDATDTAVVSSRASSTPTTTAPSTVPTAPPTTSASTADDQTIPDLAAALLTPEALPDPDAGFSWVITRDGAAARPSRRLFDPCEPTDYPTDAQRTEVLVRDLRVEDRGGQAPETARVRQNVARYIDADVAGQAVDGILAVAQACASSPGPQGTSATTEVVSADDDRLLLQTTPDIGLSTIYTVVERRGDVVTLVRYHPGEMRDADEDAQQVADAVSDNLADAAG